MNAPMIELAKVSKSFGAHQVLRGVDFSVGRSEVVCLIGPSGSGKSTLLAMRELPRALRFRRPSHRRPADRLRGRARRNARAHARADPARDAARDRHGVPALQSLAAHDRARQCRRAAAARARPERARSGRTRHGDADPGRARRQGRRLSVASLGRPAAARRHRAGAGDAAPPHAVRRADLGARSRAGRRSAGGDEEPRGGGHDDADRHPRDGLRRPCRRPHRLHRRGPHHRRGPAAPMCSTRARSRACGSFCRPTTTATRSEPVERRPRAALRPTFAWNRRRISRVPGKSQARPMLDSEVRISVDVAMPAPPGLRYVSDDGPAIRAGERARASSISMRRAGGSRIPIR